MAAGWVAVLLNRIVKEIRGQMYKEKAIFSLLWSAEMLDRQPGEAVFCFVFLSSLASCRYSTHPFLFCLPAHYILLRSIIIKCLHCLLLVGEKRQDRAGLLLAPISMTLQQWAVGRSMRLPSTPNSLHSQPLSRSTSSSSSSSSS